MKVQEIDFLSNGNIQVLGVCLGDSITIAKNKLECLNLGYKTSEDKEMLTLYRENIRLFDEDGCQILFHSDKRTNRINYIMISFLCENHSSAERLNNAIVRHLRKYKCLINEIYINERISNANDEIRTYNSKFLNNILKIISILQFGFNDNLNSSYVSFKFESQAYQLVKKEDVNNESVIALLKSYYKLSTDSPISNDVNLIEKKKTSKKLKDLKGIHLISVVIVCLTVLLAMLIYAYSNRYEIYQGVRIDKWENRAEPINHR